MNSITKNLEIADSRELWVQISEGGQVTLSFDSKHANISFSMSLKELKDYQLVIGNALGERANQIAAEVEA